MVRQKLGSLRNFGRSSLVRATLFFWRFHILIRIFVTFRPHYPLIPLHPAETFLLPPCTLMCCVSGGGEWVYVTEFNYGRLDEQSRPGDGADLQDCGVTYQWLFHWRKWQPLQAPVRHPGGVEPHYPLPVDDEMVQCGTVMVQVNTATVHPWAHWLCHVQKTVFHTTYPHLLVLTFLPPFLMFPEIWSKQ